MATLVYLTDQLRKDSRKHSYEKQITNFQQRIEDTQSLDLFDRFPPPYLKKRFERQIRLIADTRAVGDHTAVCFLRLLTRSSSEYNSFVNDPIEFGDQQLQNLVDDVTLREFVADRVRKKPPPQKPAPDEAEHRCLYESLRTSIDPYIDLVCCESREWVRRALSPRFKRRMALFCDSIYEAALDNSDSLQVRRVKGQQDLAFCYRCFPKLNKVFLVAPMVTGDAKELEQIKLSFSEANADRPTRIDILHAPAEEVSNDVVLSDTIRAYPAEILESTELWTDVEVEEEGNMALSSEEVDVLESARQANGYPLFINGRAGSGKSTILQYLFSEYVDFHLQQEWHVPFPVFFTCSRELLDMSARAVEKLLTSRHKLLQRDHPLENIKESATTIRECFREFHAFLRGLAANSDPPRFGDTSRYVDFARFKQLWFNRYSKEPRANQLYGPDISWHIIRSYIKGSSSEGFLDPTDYYEMPHKQKSVTLDTYKLVHERVWNVWYGPLTESGGAWDDQDVARYILENGLATGSFPGVFCDEAQDFTRIELEILLKLNLFSDRKVNPYDLCRVPFAFAGDPFQTLNPTGFRWESTKASFVEKFIHEQDPQKKSGLDDLNYRELTFNYRSGANIVRLCNNIQLLRSAVFDIPEIRPQRCWYAEREAPMPVFFDKADASALSKLREQSEIRIIVPCEEGEESIFVSSDSVLSSFVSLDEAGVPKNVLSASRAKGLEFPRVVLYGFGDACPRRLVDALQREQISGIADDEAIPLQYFVNRLYVAASRPKRRLFIIDSLDGLSGLWGFLRNESVRQMLLLSVRDANEWEKEIGGMDPGRTESWEHDHEDPTQNALFLETEGIRRRDSFFLRQAAQSYQNASNHIKTKECRARALAMEGSFLESATAYTEIDQFDNAIHVLWKSGERGYDRILALADEQPHLRKRIEYDVCRFFRRSASFDEGLTLVSQMEQALADEGSRLEMILDARWKAVIEDTAGRLVAYGLDSQGEGVWQVLAGTFERISNHGLKLKPNTLATLCYYAGQKGKAYEIWQSVAEADRPTVLFLESKAAATPYPGKLDVLRELMRRNHEAASAVIAAYEAEGQTGLTPTHWGTILTALRTRKRLDDALRIAENVSDVGDLFELGEDLATWVRIEDVLHIIGLITRRWTNDAAWDALLQFWEKMNVTSAERGTLHRLNSFLQEQRMQVIGKIISILAEPETPFPGDNKTKTRISERVTRYHSSSGSDWLQITDPALVGIVLERAGLFKDILPYYEKVRDSDKFDPELRRFAAVRWIKNKAKQADYEERNGHARAAREYRDEAIKHSREARITDLDAIPSVPLPGWRSGDQPTPVKETKHGTLPSPASERPSHPIELQQVEIEGFRILFSPEHKRITIEQVATMDTASVKLTEGKVTGDGGFTPDLEIPNVSVSKEWNLKVDFRKYTSEGKCTLCFGSGAEIPFSSH